MTARKLVRSEIASRSSVLCIARLVGEDGNTDIPIPGNRWELLVGRLQGNHDKVGVSVTWG